MAVALRCGATMLTAVAPSRTGRIRTGATRPAGVTEKHLRGPKNAGSRQGRSRFLHHDRGAVASVLGNGT